MKITKIVTAKRRQKGNKQDLLTGGHDLQRQQDLAFPPKILCLREDGQVSPKK